MNQWLNDFFSDFNWSAFLWESLAKTVGIATGILLSWFLIIRRRLQAMGKLESGDSDDILFQAHYLVPLEDDRVQLLFRNVAPKQTIEQIYDNPAAAKLVRSLGDETSLNQPILPTQGKTGFEILNDAAGWLSGALATSPMHRHSWLFCLTAEDRQVVRKRCVRAFVIRPSDLVRFHDWDWCKTKVTTERPWHWFRIVALHRIARLWADQCRINIGAQDARSMPLVDDQSRHRRIVTLSLGLISEEFPVSAPFEIDWSSRVAEFKQQKLHLQSGQWPAELSSN